MYTQLCGVPCDLEEEYVCQRMRLSGLVGTREFPLSCPLEFMYIPHGYMIWKELSVMHAIYLTVNEEYIV